MVVCILQLNLNNKQFSQMLKSGGPVEKPDEEPLEFYDKHTSQIEV